MSLSAVNDYSELPIKGQGTVGFQILGTFSATITFQGTIDGTNWVSLKAISLAGTTVVTTATAPGIFIANCAGLQLVRALMTAWTSGSADVTILAAQPTSNILAGSGGGAGSVVQLQGDDGSTLATVFDLTNSNPVAVVNVDANGDPISGSAVSIADGADVVEGALADAAVITGTGTVNAKLRGLLTLLNALDYDTGGGTVPQGLVGFALPASGGPVAGGTTTNPIQVNSNGTPIASQTTLAAILTALSSVAVTGPLTDTQLRATPVPVSGTVAITSATLLTEADFDTKVGSLTETAPATDTASSGLNGRLQRIAQRISSLITALGSPFQAGGSIGNTSFASTVADGANVTVGAIADAAVTAGATGSISAKLRSISRDILTNIVLAAGNNNIGDVDVASIAAGNNNIGDVDVATLPALVTGSALVGYVGVKNTYAAKATITVTLTSLTNGSARESTVVDNTSNRYRDCLIRVMTKGQGSGTAYVNIYVYESLGDTNYTDLATGSDAAFTAANRFNSRFLGAVLLNAATSAVTACFKLSDIYNTIPDKWGLIFINNSGATMSATGGDHVIEYQGVN